MNQIEIDGILVTVAHKKIKSMNLYVKVPDGHVRLSVPTGTSDRAVHAFVHAHVDWIRKQQDKLARRHPPRQFVTGELVPVFGMQYTLKVQESIRTKSSVQQAGNSQLLLTVPVDSTVFQRECVLRRWQRIQLREVAAALLEQWAATLDVSVAEWHIKRMKTKWGSCNFRAHRIWLNLSLAEQPLQCVEYVVVHELCHLLIPNHDEPFWQLMTRILPDWKQRRTQLNSNPTAQ